jgi:hypothetical protein
MKPLIRKSGLSDPPRWYVVTRYREDPKHPGVIVATTKYDVTDQMEHHIKEAVAAISSLGEPQEGER